MKPRLGRRRAARWTIAAAAGLAVATATTEVAGQDVDFPLLSETIEVRVVNVDVVVTDHEGVPIAGLGPEDFELRVNGKPVDIDYFTSIRDGSPLPREGGYTALPGVAPSAGSESLDYKPYLAVLFDGRSLDAVGSQEVFAMLRQRAEVLTDSTRGVMVVRHGRALRLDQSFTRSPEVLLHAIDRLGDEKTRAIDTGATSFLLRRLEGAERAAVNPNPDDPAGDLQIEAQAMSFLGEIRAEAQAERAQAVNAMNNLSRFVRSLAGLPGRKCVLYLGPGINVRPGEILLRLWWDKYWPLAREIGVNSVEGEIIKFRLEEDLVRLVQDAAENSVSFYTFDPAGLRSLGFDMSLDSLMARDLVGAETDWSRRALLSLATGTGGIGRMDSSRLDRLVDDMTGDFRTYYSLGFEPEDDAPDRGRIKVKVLHPGYRVRHFEHFAARDPTRRLEQKTLAALLTDEAANPLAVGVELEAGEKQKDGSWILPILLKVPLSRVTLLPREATHVGRLQVVIIAQAPTGDLSDPAHGQVPIEIDNAELLAAMNRLAGYRMRLRMRQGEQRLAIGVRDEITGEESTVNLVVDAGGPTR